MHRMPIFSDWIILFIACHLCFSSNRDVLPLPCTFRVAMFMFALVFFFDVFGSIRGLGLGRVLVSNSTCSVVSGLFWLCLLKHLPPTLLLGGSCSVEAGWVFSPAYPLRFSLGW